MSIRALQSDSGGRPFHANNANAEAIAGADQQKTLLADFKEHRKNPIGAGIHASSVNDEFSLAGEAALSNARTPARGGSDTHAEKSVSAAGYENGRAALNPSAATGPFARLWAVFRGVITLFGRPRA